MDEQPLAARRPIVGDADCEHRCRKAGGAGFGERRVELQREVEIGVAEQIAAADDDRVDAAQRGAPARRDLLAQAVAEDRLGERVTHRPRTMVQCGERRSARLGARRVTAAPGEIETVDREARQGGRQFGFQALGQQAIAEIGAELDVEQANPDAVGARRGEAAQRSVARGRGRRFNRLNECHFDAPSLSTMPSTRTPRD